MPNVSPLKRCRFKFFSTVSTFHLRTPTATLTILHSHAHYFTRRASVFLFEIFKATVFVFGFGFTQTLSKLPNSLRSAHSHILPLLTSLRKHLIFASLDCGRL
ncbi:hypothetical protein Csa_016844 [Cucumis sativus]|uniref:Uncharacterized protein n=1 Tax=Cucumis sativus TaxID=3659 RepID=A0A0A0K6L2_CUCSA|nr:hypothetical protein Csa_016844 [Cucumis sativus]